MTRTYNGHGHDRDGRCDDARSRCCQRHGRGHRLAYTFLRLNLFMQGSLGFRESIVTTGQFFAAAGDAKISAVI